MVKIKNASSLIIYVYVVLNLHISYISSGIWTIMPEENMLIIEIIRLSYIAKNKGD
jgi:hypothetical protein